MGNCILVFVFICFHWVVYASSNEDVHRLTDHAVAGDYVIDVGEMCMTKIMRHCY